jgi:magnesium-transporting ATPase (P-type)
MRAHLSYYCGQRYHRQHSDVISITVSGLIGLTVGFVQERRSEKSLEALNKLVPYHCRVLRDGQLIHILVNDVVSINCYEQNITG